MPRKSTKKVIVGKIFLKTFEYVFAYQLQADFMLQVDADDIVLAPLQKVAKVRPSPD